MVKLTILVVRLDDKKRLPVSKESGCNKLFENPESFTAYYLQPINADHLAFKHLVLLLVKKIEATAEKRKLTRYFTSTWTMCNKMIQKSFEK